MAEALKAVVEDDGFDLSRLDTELSALVPSHALKRAAAYTLRGEVLFPVPYLLQTNPQLLGYYRLLFGFSQKEFYKAQFGRMRSLEEHGRINKAAEPLITPLCRSLIQTGVTLFEVIEPLTPQIIHDLQLLTLGPQLRGSRNVDLGQAAIKQVTTLLRQLLSSYQLAETERKLTFRNDSGLMVEIAYGADPDISVVQRLGSGGERTLVAIEIKGGADYSNVWNRLGEAEKSHRTARRRGYNELWTVTAVDLDKSPGVMAKAKEKTPTTTQFFFLPRILDNKSAEGARFRSLLGSVMGSKLASD